MSTATRALLLVLAACGPNLNSQSVWVESNKNQRAWCTSQCDKGDDTGCACEADFLTDYPTNSSHRDWQDHSYQLDRANAKTLYERLCEKPNLHRTTSCDALVSKKLYTVEEALEHCKTNARACDAAALDLDLSEDQHYHLAVDHTSDRTCSMAVPTVHDDGKSAEAMIVCGLDAIERNAEQQAAGDDDDEAPTSADSACHKDTDCKGDRICQAGNCVDAKAQSPAAKPPAGPFKQPACDEFASLYDSRIVKCSQLTKGTVEDAFKYMNRDWPKLPKDRYDAVGARCAASTAKLTTLLGKLHC